MGCGDDNTKDSMYAYGVVMILVLPAMHCAASPAIRLGKTATFDYINREAT